MPTCLKRLIWGLILLAPTTGWAQVPVRVATYNIENFDPGDATQFNAAVDVLNRVGADVVCLQEIDTVSDFNTLAAATSYPFKILAHGTGTFDGSHHCGVMSKYPFNLTVVETSASLSGDPSARDITRNFIVTEVIVPGAADEFVMVGNHYKSGTADSDEFRRSIEAIRAMQITAGYDSNVIPYVVVGDMNDDLLDSPDSPTQFTSVPSGTPMDYTLGNDISFPVANGIFKPFLAGAGAQRLIQIAALQKDSSDATRNSSGRRLDYIWRSSAIVVTGSEVYDSQDEGLAGGLPKFGSPLPAGTSDNASDHLLVFADITIPDNASGACCTACGCDDTVNEAQCLALSGEFRGAGVQCGMEVPACPAPPNDMIINEVAVSHSGTQNKEFVEILGEPYELLCGLSIVVFEGEGLSKGNVDLVVSLDDCGGGPCALDENGYFVAGGSAIGADKVINSGTNIFEDGTQTIALIRDCTVAPNDDIDAPQFGGDGVEDFIPGTLLDVVGIIDADYPASDAVYFSAPILGPNGAGVPAGGARCPDGVDTDSADDWVILGSATDGSDGCMPFSAGTTNPPACGGDFNGDGTKDLQDFAAFQQCMDQATPTCAALELDGTCGITLGDYDVLSGRIDGP